MHDSETIPGVKKEVGILQCDLRDAAFLNVNGSSLLSTGRAREHLGLDFRS